MHANGAAVDNAIADQLADLLARVGHCDRRGFSLIHPHATETTAEHRRRETLLQFERRHPKGHEKPP